MKKKNKGIYGSGFLISEKAAAEKAAAEKAAAEKAAAEKAAAEKAAAEKWELSEREKEIVKKLSNQGVEDEKREANVLGS
jgi:membrane protein involved in colicin uptake